MYNTILHQIKQQIYIDYSLMIPNEISNIIRNFCLDRCLNPSIKNELNNLYSNLPLYHISLIKSCANFDTHKSFCLNTTYISIIEFNLLCSLYDIKHLDNNMHYTYYYQYHPQTINMLTFYYRLLKNNNKYDYASHKYNYETVYSSAIKQMDFNPDGFFKKIDG